MPEQGELRIWHISNLGSDQNMLHKKVGSVFAGFALLAALADYDLDLDNLIDTNAQGMEVYDDGQWVEWEDEQGRAITDDDFDDSNVFAIACIADIAANVDAGRGDMRSDGDQLRALATWFEARAGKDDNPQVQDMLRRVAGKMDAADRMVAKVETVGNET